MNSADEVAVIAVVERSGLSTVQDAGRPGWASVGVPRAGAWHQGRYRRATALVGRDDGPAVELLAGELVLQMCHPALVAVEGPAELVIDQVPAPTRTALALKGGARVRVDHRGPGPVYLALAGWQPPMLLGSSSTDTFSGLGGEPIAMGDELMGRPGVIHGAGRFARITDDEQRLLRVMVTQGPTGLDDSWLSAQWTVTASSRSGTRIAGGAARASGTVPSASMVIGAIQSTPSGEVIILGPDGGITGGYPVLGVVITADLDRVSTLVPDTAVQFKAVTVEEAIAAHESSDGRWRSAIVDPSDLRQAGGVVPG